VIGHNALVTKEKPNLICNENFPDRKNVEENCELLKLVIKKHFFTHVCLSKNYLSNKLVDVIYGPGYYEGLGKVILKSLFLFWH
jgi:hypothetical protein